MNCSATFRRVTADELEFLTMRVAELYASWQRWLHRAR